MIIVTGAAGFIGSAFITYLNKVEPETRIVAVDSENLNFLTAKNLNNLKIINYISKESFLEKLKRSIDSSEIETIIHFGAKSSTTNTNFSDILTNNFDYSKRLLSYCISHDIKFIYASSASTYGNGERFDDSMTPDECSPISPYSFFKNLFDKVVLDSEYDRALGLKYFNVFGPNEYHKDDMKSYILKTSTSIPYSDPEVFIGGILERDFIYIKDAVKMTYHLYRNDEFGMYNIGTGVSNSWHTVIGAVMSVLKMETNIKRKEIPEAIKPTYQYYTKANIEKLLQSGYKEPITPLYKAVEDYVVNYICKGRLNLKPSDNF